MFKNSSIKTRFIWVLVAVMLTTQVWSCSEYKNISEKEMQSIITELLITSSLVSSTEAELKKEIRANDTIDFYKPILKKYGYTFEDFRFTVESMNSRKSNPMENILENVVIGIKEEARIAEYRYNLALKFDTAALAYLTDTLYINDTLIRGNGKDFAIRIGKKLPVGDYNLQLDYQSMNDYNYPQKAVKYYFVNTLESNKKKTPLTIWLNRSPKPNTLNQNLNIKDKRTMDSLVIYFDESTVRRKIDNYNDTSYVTNILLTYIPELKKARKIYHYSLFGEDYIMNRSYINLTFDENEALDIFGSRANMREDEIKIDENKRDQIKSNNQIIVPNFGVDSDNVPTIDSSVISRKSLNVKAIDVDSLENAGLEMNIEE